MENKGEIIIYDAGDGRTSVSVRLEDDTVWLTQAQMAELFEKDRTVVGRHINNVYKEGELERETTCAKFAHVGADGGREYETALYNLDVIISVGYRVKSQRGTQFRIWANRVLRDYLVRGYAVSDRLRHENYAGLRQLVQVMGRTLHSRGDAEGGDESRSLLEVVVDYAYALDTLDRYDYQQLTVGPATTTRPTRFRATYEGAMQAIAGLRSRFGGSALFGNEKDGSFRSSIGQIYQTFDGEDLYPSAEEKAAMLLYLVTKNHSFTDGNKRIAATLFLWFLDNNGLLYHPGGTKRIADNTLVALTLMIAESRTEEKDTMVKVVVNLINKENR